MSHGLERDTGALINFSARCRAVAQTRMSHERAGAPRVLVVASDPAIRMLCSVNLHLLGIEVLVASESAKGFELARRERPDLVVVDLSAPGLDGLELAELVRAHHGTPNIPFIFLSREAGDDTRGRDPGSFAYVVKPLDPIVLAALIARTVESSAPIRSGPS